MLQTTDWMRIQLISATPDAFEIGHNLKQALRLQSEHEKLLTELDVSIFIECILYNTILWDIQI